MSKVVSANFTTPVISELKKALSNEQLSFVLITCTNPNEAGKMNVEMDYAGDPDLIAYLVKSAERFLD